MMTLKGFWPISFDLMLCVFDIDAANERLLTAWSDKDNVKRWNKIYNGQYIIKNGIRYKLNECIRIM